MERKEEITQLIIRFHSGETSPEENERLLQMVREDSQVKEEFLAYGKIHGDVLLSFDKPKFESDKAFDNFLEITENKSTISKKPKIIKMGYWLAASAAAILLTLIFIIQKPDTRPHQISVTTIDVVNYTLSDGSVITLNANSQLSYPDDFEKIKNERRIRFKGEGYFNIAKNPEKPFIIEMDKVLIEVKGTSFNVLYDSVMENIRVTVDTGLVKVASASNNKSVLVKENEQANYHIAKDELVITDSINLNYLSWKTGILVFESTPLIYVISDLEKYYNVNFEFENENIGRLKLDAKINQYALDDVISMLELAFHLKIEQKENVYFIGYEAEN